MRTKTKTGYMVTWKDRKGKSQFKFWTKKKLAEGYIKFLSSIGRKGKISNRLKLKFNKK